MHLERLRPRAEAVADALRELVKTRRLVPGDRLPSEADLEQMLGVGRSSVREGIQLLESLGIVEVEHGKGTFLASAIGGGLQRVIEWLYPSEDRLRLLRDLVEARIVIEGTQARLAAERATLAELDELRAGSELPSSDVDSLDADNAARLGYDYHHILGRLAHNDVLLILSNAIRALHSSLSDGLERPAEHFTSALLHHAEITDAIIAGQAEPAESAMREHLEKNQADIEAWFAKREEESEDADTAALASGAEG